MCTEVKCQSTIMMFETKANPTFRIDVEKVKLRFDKIRGKH